GGDDAGFLNAIRAIPQWRTRLSRTLDEWRPDTVLVPMMFAGLGPLVDLTKRYGCRLVYVAHDPVPHRGDRWSLAQRVVQSQVIRLADHV
ncbi:hypothetical protein, partial [Enterobacter hormaechei]|uniref:hypothetical protein n=1 Tax=Enterobacter hormaechei TaxID=158836 RepID=UPI0019544828